MRLPKGNNDEEDGNYNTKELWGMTENAFKNDEGVRGEWARRPGEQWVIVNGNGKWQGMWGTMGNAEGVGDKNFDMVLMGW
jgi:hypothetical protein